MMRAMASHRQPNFPPDINGLRAWAVLTVIFYHFGMPGFNGGFVGVDVFFVISGFLMTGLVVKGLERDQCGIKILDPTATLCRDGRCYGSQNGQPLYADDDHLSEFGNKLLVPMFRQVFEVL